MSLGIYVLWPVLHDFHTLCNTVKLEAPFLLMNYLQIIQLLYFYLRPLQVVAS